MPIHTPTYISKPLPSSNTEAYISILFSFPFSVNSYNFDLTFLWTVRCLQTCQACYCGSAVLSQSSTCGYGRQEWHLYGISSQYVGFSVIPQISSVCHRLYILLRRTVSLNVTLSLCLSPCLSLTSGTTYVTDISLTECKSGTTHKSPTWS
jgi:hypothetical protein